jgi:hypothetical protein
VNPTEAPMPGEKDLEWFSPAGRPTTGPTTAPTTGPASRPTTGPVAARAAERRSGGEVLSSTSPVAPTSDKTRNQRSGTHGRRGLLPFGVAATDEGGAVE